MEPEVIKPAAVEPPAPENEDAQLDKELEGSINALKAGQEIQPAKVESKPEEKAPEAPKPPVVETPKVEDPGTPPVDPTKPDFRIPNKGKFESDESYEKRVELFDLVKRRKNATTPEQREALATQIKTTKNQIKTLNGADKFINPPKQGEVVPVKPEEDDAMKADKERLRQLGGATKEDIENIVQQTQLATEVKSTLDRFIERHPDLKNDADTREVFFDFVDANYNWSGKSGKDLMTVLELARENMFKPSETISERVLKGANVQEKVNAMQFPGGSTAKVEYSPEVRKSIDELKATGMSEEKALELISD